MAGPAKKSFPLRVNVDVLDAMQRWSDDELRSVNAQIEYVLRDALRRAGRLSRPVPPPPAADPEWSAEDEPFLVTRPSSGDDRDEDDEDLFPVRRPPGSLDD